MSMRAQLKVDGMTCPACVRAVTRKLAGLQGVSKVAVDLAAGKATMELDDARVKVEDLIAAVDQLGYHAARG
jgi:Cu+-exporting ATPase